MMRTIENLQQCTCVCDCISAPATPVIHYILGKLALMHSSQTLLVLSDSSQSHYSNFSRLSFVDCFNDPCGWDLVPNHGSFQKDADFSTASCPANPGNNFDDVSEHIQQWLGSNSVGTQSIVLFDSISFFIALGGLQRTIRLLSKIQGLRDVKLILVLHMDMHEGAEAKSLLQLSNVVVSLSSPSNERFSSVCHLDLLRKRANGSAAFKCEELYLTEGDDILSSFSIRGIAGKDATEEATCNVATIPGGVSFSLGLSGRERADRAAVRLPFQPPFLRGGEEGRTAGDEEDPLEALADQDESHTPAGADGEDLDADLDL